MIGLPKEIKTGYVASDSQDGRGCSFDEWSKGVIYSSYEKAYRAAGEKFGGYGMVGTVYYIIEDANKGEILAFDPSRLFRSKLDETPHKQAIREAAMAKLNEEEKEALGLR